VPLAQQTADGRGSVEEWLGGVLTQVVEAGVGAGVLTQGQADDLLAANQMTVYKPGFLERLPGLCGHQIQKFQMALQVIGSACTRYLKF
jgi:hypothetical protein